MATNIEGGGFTNIPVSALSAEGKFVVGSFWLLGGVLSSVLGIATQDVESGVLGAIGLVVGGGYVYSAARS